MDQNQEQPKKLLNELATACHTIAISKGFWRVPLSLEDRNLKLAVAISLIASEAFEALDELRNGNPLEMREELADIIIRTLDLAAYLEVDMDDIVQTKMEKNRLRPYKHGKAF